MVRLRTELLAGENVGLLMVFPVDGKAREDP